MERDYRARSQENRKRVCAERSKAEVVYVLEINEYSLMDFRDDWDFGG